MKSPLDLDNWRQLCIEHRYSMLSVGPIIELLCESRMKASAKNINGQPIGSDQKPSWIVEYSIRTQRPRAFSLSEAKELTAARSRHSLKSIRSSLLTAVSSCIELLEGPDSDPRLPFDSQPFEEGLRLHASRSLHPWGGCIRAHSAASGSAATISSTTTTQNDSCVHETLQQTRL